MVVAKKEEFQFLARDEDGKLLPKVCEIDTRDEKILEQIKVYESKLKEVDKTLENYTQRIKSSEKISESEKEIAIAEMESRANRDKAVYSKMVEMFKQHYEESGRTFTLSLKPMTMMQVRLIQKKGIGPDGKEYDDQDAAIISQHCLEPKFTYAEACDMTSDRERTRIVNEILNISLPDKKVKEEQKKKINSLLGDRNYLLTTSSLEN